jgi:hypothetical protein
MDWSGLTIAYSRNVTMPVVSTSPWILEVMCQAKEHSTFGALARHAVTKGGRATGLRLRIRDGLGNVRFRVDDGHGGPHSSRTGPE